MHYVMFYGGIVFAVAAAAYAAYIFIKKDVAGAVHDLYKWFLLGMVGVMLISSVMSIVAAAAGKTLQIQNTGTRIPVRAIKPEVYSAGKPETENAILKSETGKEKSPEFSGNETKKMEKTEETVKTQETVEPAGTAGTEETEKTEETTEAEEAAPILSVMAAEEEFDNCIIKDGEEKEKVLWTNKDVELKLETDIMEIKTITYKIGAADEVIIDCEKEKTDLTSFRIVVSETCEDFNGLPVMVTVNSDDDKTATWSGRVMIDKKQPTSGEIIFENEKKNIYKKDGFFFSNEKVTVRIKLKDEQSGIDDKSVKAVLVTENQKHDLLISKIAPEKESENDIYYAYIPEDAGVESVEGYVSVTAVDAAGNEFSRDSRSIIYSRTAPIIRLEGDKGIEGWTNDKVKLHLEVKTPKCGIRRVVFYVAGKKIREEKPASILPEYAIDLFIDKNAKKYNGYFVEVRAIDNCGNEARKKVRVFLDREAPVVKLTGADMGGYYTENVCLTLSVFDVSFNNTIAECMITRTLDGEKHIENIEPFMLSGYEDKREILLSKEGRYEIYAVATDGAGNQTVTATLSFVIDKTAPIVSLKGVKDKSVKNENVRLKFVCEESFYDTNDVVIKVRRTYRNNHRTEELDIFDHDKRLEKKSYVFSEDGEYEVRINAEDMAGNKSNEEVVRFTIDKTAPQIYITGTNAYKQWDEEVKLRFMVREAFFESSRVELTGSRTDMDGNVTPLDLSDFLLLNESSSMNEVFTEDGIYQIGIKVKDKAGNEDRKRVHFLIDRSAPVIFGMEELDGKCYRTFGDEELQSIGVKDLTLKDYSLIINGVECAGGISVEEDGEYVLKAYAIDELGHINEKQVCFVVDNTPPAIKFLGMDNGEMVREKGSVSWELEDPDDEIVEICINGKEYDAKQKEFSYNKYGNYDIRITAKDRAGNESVSDLCFEYSGADSMRNPVDYKEHDKKPEYGLVSYSRITACVIFVVVLLSGMILITVKIFKRK